MSDSHRHSSTDKIRAFVFLALLLLVGALALQREEGGNFKSAELGFTDRSQQGLSIVPASCPSDPHYSGDCSAPTCSITLTPSTIGYGSSATLSWSSTNANTSFYITGIGYVGASGSASVSPGSSTTYTGTVTHTATDTTVYTGSCSATLTVNPPPQPVVTSSANYTTITVGASTIVSATFAASSGDTLTGTAIDSPAGTHLTSATPAAGKSYTFTPSSAGTFTFYGRATTQYYQSWTTYSQVNVVVNPAPACTVALAPTSIQQGQSATLSYSSTNATSFSINNVGSIAPNTSGSTTVSPSQSTDYTGSASAGGVTNTCKASNTTPSGTLTVTCTPSTTYSCPGGSNGVIRTTTTNAQCAVTTSDSAACTAPSFCSAGSAICLFPPPQFNQSGSGSSALSGHLQANPQVLQASSTITVSWNISYVNSCSVNGSNGDAWSGSTGIHTSSIIKQQTTYTLSCNGQDGSTIHESVIVNVLPTFQEK